MSPKKDLDSPQSQPQSTTPLLKWAGGKRSLLGEIKSRMPILEGSYYEPFLGGGAVFFSMTPGIRKIGSDTNSDLIDFYEAVRDEPKSILFELSKMPNTLEHFLEVRAWDRDEGFQSIPRAKRAARFLYLNKTCYNGLYRVNSRGQFNTPFGYYKNPDYASEQKLMAMSTHLNQEPQPELLVSDYKSVLRLAKPKDFVYLDPPYDPISKTSSFVAYQGVGFGREQQEELRDELLELSNRGVDFMLSNNNTEFIRKLYGDPKKFSIETIAAQRPISGRPQGRGKVLEVLIRGIS